MRLYRLEAADSEFNGGVNRGVYSSGLYKYLLSEEAYYISDERSPLPTDDVRLKPQWLKIRNTEDYVFAFESLDSVLRWFHNKENLRIHSDKYLLVEYNVDDSNVMLGTAQCVFNYKTYISRQCLPNNLLYGE